MDIPTRLAFGRPPSHALRGGGRRKAAAYGSNRPELVLLNAALIVSNRAATSAL